MFVFVCDTKYTIVYFVLKNIFSVMKRDLKI